MNEINPVARTGPTSATSGPRPTAAAASADAPAPTRGSDKAEISVVAQYLSKLQSLPDVRQGLVDQVRGQIASGTYQTPQKLDTAIDNMAEDLPH